MAKPTNDFTVKKCDFNDTDSNEKDLKTVSSLSTKPSENKNSNSNDDNSDNTLKESVVSQIAMLSSSTHPARDDSHHDGSEIRKDNVNDNYRHVEQKSPQPFDWGSDEKFEKV